jgi:hypothetical protein
MKPKRRKRAVAFGALLALMCLTAIPATSAAYIIKWYFPPQVTGEPDMPSTGTFLIRVGGMGLSFVRLEAGLWMISPVRLSSQRMQTSRR